MKKINNKGFTIAEVLVSFSLITIILASIISATVFYRDRLKQEEVVSQLLDFKNTITKIVYDDIISGNIISVERCIGTANCINFIDTGGNARTLKIVEVDRTGTEKRGIYLYYNNTKYMLPDSDLGVGDDRICDFINGFTLEEYPEGSGRLFKVKTTIYHKDIDLYYDLLFVIS